eukprot:TRINITY_DN47712_c0_g2_i1.p1 TRINITY_DN47712_c0_g2~~TRINITY_DN47712_c0_g2_i1.p1  ORF type:complete len:513 (-),score=115.24 TRINITY_DN47712_c0_g2_i1:739-2277(-)
MLLVVLVLILVLTVVHSSTSTRDPQTNPAQWFSYTSSDILKLDADPGLDVFEFLFSPAISVEPFLNNFFEKQIVYVPRNDSEYFAQLFPMMVLDGILDTSAACMNDLKRSTSRMSAASIDAANSAQDFEPMVYGKDVFLVKRTVGDDGDYWSGILQMPDGVAFSSSFARNAFSRGYSLVLNKLNCRWKILEKLSEQLMKQCFGFRTNINMYFTPANSHAFEPHFDWMESIVLQLQGSKKWTIHQYSPESSVKIPFPSQKFKPTNTSLGPVETEVLMNPGDVLYFPRGFVHQATTAGLNDNSMHLTIGIEIDPLFTWTGLVILSIKHIEKEHHPEWAQSHEFAMFLALDAALEPENYFLRRAVPFGQWINSPTAGRHEFHEMYLRVLERLMDVIDYKRAKRRIQRTDEATILSHFHESFQVYFAQLINSITNKEPLRLGKKDLLDVPLYMQQYGLFESVMQEFVVSVKTAKKQGIYRDRFGAEINYRRLTEFFSQSSVPQTREGQDGGEKDEL